MAQLVSQLALATFNCGTPTHRIGVQKPVGVDQFPVAVLHAEKGEPVAAPVQVAVHCVWLLQPLDGHAAFSGVVEGTPEHGFVACFVTGQAVPDAIVHVPVVEQVADTVPPVEQGATHTKPGS